MTTSGASAASGPDARSSSSAEHAVPPVPTPFDLLGPLPSGTTVLEASAGTGKTFTIAALVTRFLAEGTASMDQMLVVSFSRDATRELRERVRERMVSARDGLAELEVSPAARDSSGRTSAAAASGPDVLVTDALLEALSSVAPHEVTARRKRLDEALAEFDAATVTTTHGFCQQVLAALGTAADHDPGAILLENPADLIHEVADDLYLRKWGVAGAGRPQLSREQFTELARAAAGDASTLLLPVGAVGGEPELRAKIAGAVRREVEVRKRRQHLIDYDDMLQRLATTLTDPHSAAAAKARLRSRYRVVLVDEFQDTDPVQWTILREAFHGACSLVLIGDPKQAIYRFRGADVHAYLQAVDSAESVSTLQVNWRSDSLLLDGITAVFRGAALGDERIRVLPVTPAFLGRMVPGPAPVRLRVLLRGDLPVNSRGLVAAGAARDEIVHDLAAEVLELLTGGQHIHPRDGSSPRPVLPGDIAVLTRTGKEALQVEEVLRAAQIPVVLSSRTSVFLTRAAEEWQLLLEALEQPHRTTRVRRFALSCFVGLGAEDLDGTGLPALDELAFRLRGWGAVLAERGVAALFEAVSLDRSLQPRVLATQGGERLLTDLRHVGETLHAAALEGQLGLAALLTWLRRRRRETAGEEGAERSRRLESDAAAVQVITVHTSKGLEFPIVLVPFAWSQWAPSSPATVVFHGPDGRRVRDVGGPQSPDWGAHAAANRQEEIDDELRLTYVALTRAQGHLVLWWAPTSNTATSPLHRLLMRDVRDVSAPLTIPVPADTAVVETLRERAASSGGGLAVEPLEKRPVSPWVPAPAPTPALLAAQFARGLDAAWRRTSYSSLTAAAHEQSMRLGSESEIELTGDEADVEEGVVGSGPAMTSAPDDLAALADVMSAWSDLPGGAGFGTLVHGVLETLQDDWTPQSVHAVVAQQIGRLAPGTDVDLLTEALVQAVDTPLGPLADDLPLTAISGADRLPELDFELPLTGGDEAAPTQVLLTDLARLWRAHCPDGLLHSYADALEALDPTPLRGYLTGSIDAVLRVGPPEHRRYVVVDYKTNRLAGREEPLTAWHYRPDALEQAMIGSHYPLQALLYSVALHRFLRWRVADYDPAEHLGGTLYLFLRGMCGPGLQSADGAVPGIFAWHPSPALVTATSDLLAGRR